MMHDDAGEPGARAIPGGATRAASPPSHPSGRRSSAAAWLLAIRPKTLPAAVAPVLVGSACAYAIGGFRTGPAIAALIGALLLQIASNLANDVIDFEKGLDTADRLGPTRVVQAGLLSARAVTIGLLVVIGLAVAVGIYLTMVAGIAVVVMGIASILAAIAYTGGPYPLGYNGLGEVAVMIFFGFVAVCGTTYVQALDVPALAWWAAIPVGTLTTAILVVNNLRDLETDARGGKRTIAVRIGRTNTIREYKLLLGVAYATTLLISLTYADGFVRLGSTVSIRLENLVWLLTWLSLPLAYRLMRRVESETGRALNPVLAGTAQLLFVFSALLAAGIALGAR